MMLAQTEIGRNGRRRKLPGQITKQSGGYRGAASKVIVMDNGRTGASHGQLDRTANGTKPVVVMYWLADGTCHEGKTRHVGGQTIFIESKQVVPVGTEVMIRLTPPKVVLADWSVAEGAVVWTCPTADQFQNREGFGVALQGRWPEPSRASETEASKGSA